MNSKGKLKNKHGLARHIPEPIKRQVRQECGFGCVVCGNAIAQYEHIEPEFSDAKVHDPEKIAYLCGSCHDNVTRGLWSKNKILDARQNPKSFKQGISKSILDIDLPFTFKLGSSTFTNTPTFLEVRKNRLIYVEPPEEIGGPVRLSCQIYDSSGVMGLSIYRNEVIVKSDVWDCQIVGNTFTVRKGPRDIVFEFVVDPPHTFTITKLDMLFIGMKFKIIDDDLHFINQNGHHHRLGGGNFNDSVVAIFIE